MRSTRRALVVGGSLAGMFAASTLRATGWDVQVFERSRQALAGRGGGIVLQPDILQTFGAAGVPFDPALAVATRERIYLGSAGEIAERIPMRQQMTSWSALHAAMSRHLGASRYHAGMALTGVSATPSGISVRFADGHTAEGELLVGADGPGSAVRGIYLPGTTPAYAGYIAWRGLVPESELDGDTARLLADRFTFFNYPNAHILIYLVPGADEAAQPGRRRYNWAWYRNAAPDRLHGLLLDRTGRRRSTSVPPGLLSEPAEADLRAAAARFLPPPLQALVAATREPFLQVIQDLAVPEIAFGRVALCGDAAFIARPHTAAGAAKAAENAASLARALAGGADVAAGLRRWAPEQVLMGENLVRHGLALGRSQAAYPAGTPT